MYPCSRGLCVDLNVCIHLLVFIRNVDTYLPVQATISHIYSGVDIYLPIQAIKQGVDILRHGRPLVGLLQDKCEADGNFTQGVSFLFEAAHSPVTGLNCCQRDASRSMFPGLPHASAMYSRLLGENDNGSSCPPSLVAGGPAFPRDAFGTATTRCWCRDILVGETGN